jgi:hypothetical protein
MTSVHDYTSTACLHDLCEACRRSCKFCDSPCQCARDDCVHDDPGSLPVPWVDQARDVARQMFAVLPMRNMPLDLFQRIGSDPDLFWLRGEEAPPGVGS